ncbi:MAG: hypothetical protein WC878_00060 [Candidatus Paceibacterota bacterium]
MKLNTTGAMPEEKVMTIVRGRKVIEEHPWVEKYINKNYNAEILVSRELDFYNWKRNTDDKLFLFDSDGNELGCAGLYAVRRGFLMIPFFFTRIPIPMPFLKKVWLPKYEEIFWIEDDYGCKRNPFVWDSYRNITLNQLLNSLDKAKYHTAYALCVQEVCYPRRFTFYKPPKGYKSFGHYADGFLDGYKIDDIEKTYEAEKAELETFFSDE